MHGIVTLLPQPLYDHVEQIWDGLETNYGLKGIRVTPYPHFSWQIGEDYALDRLEAVFTNLAQRIRPFTVHTTGLGLFTGSQPVLFLPVVKSPQLVEVHQQIWMALATIAQGVSKYYNPENWVPHISLAYTDLTSGNIGPVIQSLVFSTRNWEFKVDNLAFIHEPTGAVGELKLSVGLTE